MTETKKKSNGVVTTLVINFLEKIVNYNSRTRRISSMFLDHFSMTMLIVPPIILLSIIFQTIGWELNDRTESSIFYLMIFIYLNKDFFNGKSIAKRILGYQVIDRKTEAAATELQCFLRNLTICIAWPLEVIIGFINPKRRIGDFFANTKLIVSEKEKLQSIWTELKMINWKSNYIMILLIGAIYFYALEQTILFIN